MILVTVVRNLPIIGPVFYHLSRKFRLAGTSHCNVELRMKSNPKPNFIKPHITEFRFIRLVCELFPPKNSSKMSRKPAKDASKGAPAPSEDFADIARNNLKRAAAGLGINVTASVSEAFVNQNDPTGQLEDIRILSSQDVDAMQVKAASAAILARGNGMRVPALRTLKRVFVRECPIGDAGVCAVAEVIRDGCVDSIGVRLEAVELMGCGMHLTGAKFLADALVLGANCSVTSLNLDFNTGIGSHTDNVNGLP